MSKSLKAKDIMTSDVITIGPEVTLGKAIKKLLDRKISGMPVADESGKMIGITSEKYILNFIFDGYVKSTTVETAMNRNVVYFSPETSIKRLPAPSQKTISCGFRL